MQMPINRYNKALKLVQGLKSLYKTDIIKFDVLVSELKKQVGYDETRTVAPYIKLMRDEGLITQMSDSSMIKLGGNDGSE